MALSLRPLNPDVYPPGVFRIPRQANVFCVGREKGNDLQVNHASVSALHARIVVSEGAEVDVIDCGSSNGTFLNGIKVVERRALAVGDLLRFASAEFRVTADLDISVNDEASLNGATSTISSHVVSDNERERALLEESRNDLESELAAVRAENALLREQLEREGLTIATCGVEIRSLSERLEERLNLEDEKQVSRVAEIKLLSDKLNEQLKTERNIITIRDAEVASGSAEIAALSSRLREQEDSVRRLHREIEDLAQREQRNQNQLSETRKSLMEREGSIAALQYEVTKRDGNLRQLGDQVAQLQEVYDQYVVAYADLQAELATRDQALVAATEARMAAETTTAGVLERLSQLKIRLFADWSFWFQGDDESAEPPEVEASFTRVEGVAARIRGELDLIEPIWLHFGEGVQAELIRRCDYLHEEEAGLLAETEARRVELAEVTGNLEQLRELVDTEVRRAQGLSRRGTEIEIPERFESMVIARDREQEIYRSLIERLEGLDRLLEGYRHSRKLREIVIELEEFRSRFVSILDLSGVSSFDLPVRTMLTLKHRKEVQILSRKGWGTRQYTEFPFQPGEIVKVIRPGYRVGEGESAVILRKVEVLIRGVGD